MTALPPPPQPTVAAIWAALEARHVESGPEYDGYGISASALGSDCDRQLWYGLRWVSPQEVKTGRKLRIFERGRQEEAEIVGLLKLAGLALDETDPATGQQWRFALAGGWLRGKADGKATGAHEAPKALHVVEIKSAKAADFRAIVKHGLAKAKPPHWHQLHSGMVGLGADRGLYVVSNKDTQEIHTERLRLDHEEAARQEARVLRIVGSDDAPSRISDKPGAFACGLCNHKAICHGDSFARRTCRSCAHWTFTTDGNGYCERFHEPRRPDAQKAGADCPAHLYLPALVPGEQIDCDPEAETITYHMRDGSEWTDGANEEAKA